MPGYDPATMSFFAVLLALLIEQAKPLPPDNFVHQASADWAELIGRNFDAGRGHHAWVVWAMAVVAPALLTWLVYFGLTQASVLLALAFDVAVLYLTLGFRQFSHWFTDIRDALERGDDEQARSLLSRWQRLDASTLPREQVLRHVVEQALLEAHRHVFGVFFWFVVMSTLGLGPAGAVMYRMAGYMARHRSRDADAAHALAHERVQQAALAAFDWIDAMPARLTAFGFAVVGNFEEAINGWRRDAGLWPRTHEGVILAAAAGALGVQLGGATPGASLEPSHLQNVVGLVWRSVVLWMLLLALLSLAHVLG